MKIMTSILTGALLLFSGTATAHSDLTRENVQSVIEACQNGNANACESLADALRDRDTSRELGIRYNPQNSLNAATIGCDLGHIGACYDAARILSVREYRMIDIPRAKSFLEGPCSKGVVDACRRLEKLQ